MPQVLEMQTRGDELWVRIEKPKEDTGYFYIWTATEAKQAKESAVRSFCFDLANRYIEDPAKGVGI